MILPIYRLHINSLILKSSKCSDKIEIIKSVELNDTSWLEYIHEVYGSYDSYSGDESIAQPSSSNIDELTLSSLQSSPSSSISSSLYYNINKYNINFYYKNTNIQIQPIDWNKDKVFGNSYSKSDNYRNGYLNNHIISNYTWIEISRFSSEFLWHNFQEGYTSPPWYRHSDPIKVPYGCWFFIAKGTGIYINVHITLAFHESLDYHHDHDDYQVDINHDNNNQSKKSIQGEQMLDDKLDDVLHVFPELNNKTKCYNNDKSKRCKDKCMIFNKIMC